MYRQGDIIALHQGAWRLQAPLAASSYGMLWRAANVASGAPAALKLVNTGEMGAAPAALRRHWRDGAAAEAAFLRSLQPWDGRHIVRLLDAGEIEGCPALALELMHGDLRSLLALRGRPPLAQACEWIRQVNTALAKVHQYGWRHLDLKPANLLVDATGATLKLADFGTCRRLDDRAAHTHVGTAGWQAPEQYRPGANGDYRTDARSDYYALGALLYHLVTGARLRPAPAAGAAAVPAPDEAALFERRVLPAGERSARAMLALLRALLAPRPEDRPRHALDISRMLERAGAARLGHDAHGHLASAA